MYLKEPYLSKAKADVYCILLGSGDESAFFCVGFVMGEDRDSLRSLGSSTILSEDVLNSIYENIYYLYSAFLSEALRLTSLLKLVFDHIYY